MVPLSLLNEPSRADLESVIQRFGALVLVPRSSLPPPDIPGMASIVARRQAVR